jgi:hypothetical protein
MLRKRTAKGAKTRERAAKPPPNEELAMEYFRREMLAKAEEAVRGANAQLEDNRERRENTRKGGEAAAQ